MVLPFGLLLVGIALGSLLFSKWWARHYAKVAFGLGAVTLTYYLAGLRAHERVLHVGHEYISFIILIGSLFVVAGGIHIRVKGEATPLTNVAFLAVGAVLANLLGTTGASMLLIRPWIRLNRYRVTAHHVVFFIFIVSNVGGCLTPVGDPPLFLGYLKGIPFWWVAEHCWHIWLVGVGTLLLMFTIVDYRNYLRAPKEVRASLAEPAEEWHFDGLGNLFFLGAILGSLFLTHPPFLREALMLGAAVGSYLTTRRAVHEANHFSFQPIREVAILFAGLFATMIPALDWLQLNAGRMNHSSSTLFYWASGSLSSVLDNAPTYLSFLSALFGAFVNRDIVDQLTLMIQNHGAAVSGAAEPIRQTYMALQKYFGAALADGAVTPEQVDLAFLLGNEAYNNYIVAISVAAVFFGANTYIGNGPNFMVKAIAEQSKVHTPTFLGYILRFTFPYMLPMLSLVYWLFFRH
jgi:Na+/H+ antiporter NhaD/arsenite permease-like protein